MRPARRRDPVQSMARLHEVATLLPEAPHREAEANGGLAVGAVRGAVDGRPDVVMFSLEDADPAGLLAAGQDLCRRLGEVHVGGPMAALQLVAFATRCEHLTRVFADRVEQPEAGLALDLIAPNEALIDERGDAVEHILAELIGGSAHRLGAIEIESAREDRQAIEQPPARAVEDVVAPGDGGPEGLLPLREVARVRDQHRKLLIEAGQDLLRREDLHPGRREFERQRHPMETDADRGDGRRVLVRHREARLDRDGAGDEQADGLVLVERPRIE